MKKLTSLGVFLFALTGLTSHLFAQSAPGNCVAAPLSTYDVQGFECHLKGANGGGVLLFGGFSFDAGTSSYTDSQIEVTPEPQGEGGGFSFSLVSLEPFSAAAGQTVDFDIDYAFAITVDPFVSGAQLGMDPPSGNVVITEDLCVDPFAANRDLGTGPGCSSSYSFSVDDTNPPTSWSNSVQINPPAHHGADVTLDFLLTGGDGTPSTFDALSADNDVVDTLSPEPVSSVLGLGGLLAIAVRRRYRNA
ncbi:MAG TPA: hypothetical protein VG297_22080 [Bryobacteraceae bacterium]|jgi:hypothetical protein|nr:hypothetical protein [Bryobacteraceae bacterium]